MVVVGEELADPIPEEWVILREDADEEDLESVEEGEAEEPVLPMPLVALPLMLLVPPIETIESRSLK